VPETELERAAPSGAGGWSAERPKSVDHDDYLANSAAVTAAETTTGYIVFHYPAQGFLGELTRRVEAAVTALRATEGCLGANSWVTHDNDAVVATGTWCSEAALKTAFAICREQGVDFQFDERERQPRSAITLRPTTHNNSATMP